jgi:hypothetical protein
MDTLINQLINQLELGQEIVFKYSDDPGYSAELGIAYEMLPFFDTPVHIACIEHSYATASQKKIYIKETSRWMFDPKWIDWGKTHIELVDLNKEF